MSRRISAKLEISQYLHCRLCIDEVYLIAKEQGSASPAEYSRLSIGWTKLGLQVWCQRHEVNVCHIDFEGAQHPANQAREAPAMPKRPKSEIQ